MGEEIARQIDRETEAKPYAKIAQKLSVCFAFLFCVSLALPLTAKAATIYISPATGSYNVSKTFSVGVYVSSQEQAMNAISGVISFPTEKLEVVSISKSGSVVNLWVQEPSFSNNAGTINLEGVVLNPGFIGTTGKVLTISFKAKSAGRASVLFTAGNLLANDGQGTSILTGMGGANFDLTAVSEVETPEEDTEPVVQPAVPRPPVLYSPTHPDPGKWYNLADAEFNWVLASDITGVSIFGDRSPDTSPSAVSDGMLTEYKFENVEEGVWYFHIRARNRLGWGQTGHFRFNVDTENPESFEIKEVDRKDRSDPMVEFIFEAVDKTSGIDHFEIQIDDKGVETVSGEEPNYITPSLGSGKHILKAKAVDKSGNFMESSIEFVVEKLPPPIFTDYPSTLDTDQFFVLEGMSKEGSDVNLYIQKDREQVLTYALKTSETGRFRYVADDKLKEGVYKVWADAVGKNGAKSEANDPIKIIVRPSELMRFGMSLITALSIIIPIIGLLILLIFILWYSWHKFKKFRNRLQKDIRRAENNAHMAFKKLRLDVKKQIDILEKTKKERELTESEKRMIKQLKNDLNDAEGIISKEFTDIEKEVKDG